MTRRQLLLALLLAGASFAAGNYLGAARQAEPVVTEVVSDLRNRQKSASSGGQESAKLSKAALLRDLAQQARFQDSVGVHNAIGDLLLYIGDEDIARAFAAVVPEFSRDFDQPQVDLRTLKLVAPRDRDAAAEALRMERRRREGDTFEARLNRARRRATLADVARAWGITGRLDCAAVGAGTAPHAFDERLGRAK